MKIASVSEAKNTLSALLDLVRAGESVVIVDRGTPVAQLVGLTDNGAREARIARLERSGLVRPSRGGISSAIASPAPTLPPGHGRAALDALFEERLTGR
jgi:prevent-host-death family protein